MRAFEITDETQIGEARRAAIALAAGLGFDATALGRTGIVVTELAGNIRKHAGSGWILLGTSRDAAGEALDCLALDKGRGIADLAAAQRDGFSTAGSPGAGLGAVRRQSHTFDIFSVPRDSEGHGTALLARLRGGRLPLPGAPAEAAARVGAVSIARRGESVNGDDWAVRETPRGLALLVIDGLGHGALAADAARAGVRAFIGDAALPPGEMLQRLHAALRPTRGAAASIAELRRDAGNVIFAGIGNVAGALLLHGATRRMVTHNGTLGHTVKRVQEFSYPCEDGALVLMATDGLVTGWTPHAYPGVAARHPTLIAGLLWRDFARPRDDATVLVARVQA